MDRRRDEGRFKLDRQGKTIAYAHTLGKFSTIYSVDVGSKERTSLLRKEGILSSPTFSPDGSKMVFGLRHVWRAEYFYKGYGVGRHKTSCPIFGNYNTSPAFSPKGDFIAFRIENRERFLEVCVMRT